MLRWSVTMGALAPARPEAWGGFRSGCISSAALPFWSVAFSGSSGGSTWPENARAPRAVRDPMTRRQSQSVLDWPRVLRRPMIRPGLQPPQGEGGGGPDPHCSVAGRPRAGPVQPGRPAAACHAFARRAHRRTSRSKPQPQWLRARRSRPPPRPASMRFPLGSGKFGRPAHSTPICDTIYGSCARDADRPPNACGGLGSSQPAGRNIQKGAGLTPPLLVGRSDPVEPDQNRRRAVTR